MPSFFRNKRLITILVSLILLVALIGFSMRDRDQLTLPEEFVLDVVGGLQTVFHTPINFVTNTIDNIQDLRHTYEENALLRERINEFKGLKEEVQLLEQENKELKSILDKEESIDEYDLIQASVIARSPEPRWFEQLTINKGSNQGIKPNMAVITGQGLIGKVETTSATTSKVKLLSGFDRSNVIHAMIVGEGKNASNQFGLIEAPDEEQNEYLLLKRIPYEAEIKKDQKVVSSGMGGVFPKGLPIGTVKDVIVDEYGLTQTAYIKPAADLYDINHVAVVDREIHSPVLNEEEATDEEKKEEDAE
ncbi:rod shape-determining protein MreC [Pontibacillus litoralis]|uniref:Cell shape-determining protein MreC n=1 Tax=Pontibacillus litoralis JSM 072002 TaxID=1385512 RepID=A0A0A5GD46_9BACI|nr:rod shape-determining protein MreC [Pontibacillus litoralis]KGX89015.1 rod shape-determining protein MreC [Pontibacillus litoralis JSM 072002]